MREIVIQRCLPMSWLDKYDWENIHSLRFKTYKEYLESLDDDDLLSKFIDLYIIEANLD